jgi:cell wall-associated NlpC family hydrolase
MIILEAYALSFLGTPYRWGGNNAIHGFDCSGLVMELLKSTGEKLPQEDMTAQMIFDHYQAGNGEWNRQSIGALAFYGESVLKVTHVAMLLDEYRIIEAAGGNPMTLTVEDAALRNAVVRIRPIKYRKDLTAIIRPYFRGIGLI